MFSFFFFFQAEDGIRDGRVTGVQTCALPIYLGTTVVVPRSKAMPNRRAVVSPGSTAISTSSTTTAVTWYSASRRVDRKSVGEGHGVDDYRGDQRLRHM